MTDPIDDTKPRASAGSGAGEDDPPNARTDGPPAGDGDEASAADPGPSMRADPNRPADSGWREPPWFPPRDRERDHRPSPVAIIIGIVLIAIGLYYFLDRTLGIDLPGIQWSTAWPIILIVLGGLILVRSFQRKS